MIKNPLFEAWSEQLGAMLPPAAKQCREDIEKAMQVVLQQAFEKMDLVTRQEFEVQTQVLARTRALLESLESRVAALEQKK